MHKLANSAQSFSLFMFLALSAGALAAPAEDHWSISADDAAKVLLEEAQTYISNGKFGIAVSVLREAAEVSPDNPDVWNLMGFSQRNRGRLQESAVAYAKALSLDPDHLGALEYQGELYLLTGDLAGAEANLDRLRTLCPVGCGEQDALAAAIDAFHKND